MKPIVEELIDYGLSLSHGERVADIRIGLGYTAVKLESGKAGVAATLRYLVGKGPCTPLPQAGTLAGMDAEPAIALLRSPNVVEASIGLAAREICLMGPSTHFVPDIFRARGITLLAGRRITDADQLLCIVSEAGGTKRFRAVTEKVDIVLK